MSFLVTLNAENSAVRPRVGKVSVCMGKIKCMMEKKETRMLLLAIVGIIMVCMIICMAKLSCHKKKKKEQICEQC